ncbi:MAG: Panacea domain-containing protein [bacterium]|nr:Panacea domain-containing protein [bacterium]
MSKKTLQTLNVEDYILYILNKLEPEKSDKIRLNKLAFLIEFSYLYHFNKDLSEANYAAIDHGPVIDKYEKILKNMQKKNLIKMDGYIIRPLKSSSKNISEETCGFIDSVIEKYSRLTNTELIGLSHLTDAYKITTDNERIMGKLIDKKLALLETFFDDTENAQSMSEDDLPEVDRDQLTPYEHR